MAIDWGMLMESLPGVGDNPTTAEFWADTWDEGGLEHQDKEDLNAIIHNIIEDRPQDAGLGTAINNLIQFNQLAAGGTSRLLDKASGPYSMQDELDKQDERHAETNELYRELLEDNHIRSIIEEYNQQPAWNKKSTYRNMFPKDSIWPTMWKASKDAYKKTFPLAKPSSRVQPLSENEMLY